MSEGQEKNEQPVGHREPQRATESKLKLERNGDEAWRPPVATRDPSQPSVALRNFLGFLLKNLYKRYFDH